jgi:hypothetical protein
MPTLSLRRRHCLALLLLLAFGLLAVWTPALAARPTIDSVAISYIGNGTLTILGSNLANASVTIGTTAIGTAPLKPARVIFWQLWR